MKKEDLRIVYMGTPDFAVEALRQLVEGGYNVVGVITMPDKPAGRGHKIQYSPVKQYALEQNLPLLQPEKLKDEAFVQALREWKADLQIVVAGGGLEYAAVGYFQPARFVASSVSGCCSYQLGGYQRRYGDWYHYLLPATRD